MLPKRTPDMEESNPTAALRGALHDGYELAAKAARSMAEAMEDGSIPALSGPEALRHLAMLLDEARSHCGDVSIGWDSWLNFSSDLLRKRPLPLAVQTRPRMS